MEKNVGTFGAARSAAHRAARTGAMRPAGDSAAHRLERGECAGAGVPGAAEVARGAA